MKSGTVRALTIDGGLGLCQDYHAAADFELEGILADFDVSQT